MADTLFDFNLINPSSGCSNGYLQKRIA